MTATIYPKKFLALHSRCVYCVCVCVFNFFSKTSICMKCQWSIWFQTCIVCVIRLKWKITTLFCCKSIFLFRQLNWVVIHWRYNLCVIEMEMHLLTVTYTFVPVPCRFSLWCTEAGGVCGFGSNLYSDGGCCIEKTNPSCYGYHKRGL